MTFIGAAVVTLTSSIWFFFNSPRYQFFESLGLAARSCRDILDTSVNTVLSIEDGSAPAPPADYSTAIPVPLLSLHHTRELKQMEGLVRSMESNLDDIFMEPTLWRPSIDSSKASRIVQDLNNCRETFVLLDMVCARMLIDPGEVRRSGLLHTSALPQVIAMREALSQALRDVLEMITYALHPIQEMPLQWRPTQIVHCQRRLLESSLSTAFQVKHPRGCCFV